MTQEREREDFEKDASKTGYVTRRLSSGRYESRHLEARWAGWQARASRDVLTDAQWFEVAKAVEEWGCEGTAFGFDNAQMTDLGNVIRDAITRLEK